MAIDAEAAGSPVNVKKIGHVVFKARDIEASTKFWTEVMGFHVSDRNEIGMVFFRTASDHHTIALAPAKDSSEVHSKEGPGFDHCAMEIGSVRELFKIRDHLKKHGVKIVFEGRRGAGCNVGIEFLDPDGNMIELYASMDQIGWEGESRPREQWRRATTLEEAVANPVPGARYEV
jgi:catechol 2,3-dioxygenase-like lactoylglutathione lyase family enzyme